MKKRFITLILSLFITTILPLDQKHEELWTTIKNNALVFAELLPKEEDTTHSHLKMLQFSDQQHQKAIKHFEEQLDTKKDAIMNFIMANFTEEEISVFFKGFNINTEKLKFEHLITNLIKQEDFSLYENTSILKTANNQESNINDKILVSFKELILAFSKEFKIHNIDSILDNVPLHFVWQRVIEEKMSFENQLDQLELSADNNELEDKITKSLELDESKKLISFFKETLMQSVDILYSFSEDIHKIRCIDSLEDFTKVIKSNSLVNLLKKEEDDQFSDYRFLKVMNEVAKKNDSFYYCYVDAKVWEELDNKGLLRIPDCSSFVWGGALYQNGILIAPVYSEFELLEELHKIEAL